MADPFETPQSGVAPTQPHPQESREFAVDSSAQTMGYVNFCRVTSTPEELVLDIGLNVQMSPVPAEPVKLTHRLVMNYFTAKRLLGALYQATQRHESVYGVLEVDIQKRVQSVPRQGAGGSG